ncbi:hypothetical protein FH587_04230 (plasmid) [Leptospira interrogans]|uniref:hypothetical protein n=1 Tax=Leptospira interrogans TaxID=173 RepID=UPI001F07D23F|nr:hypothetical protein [Leptospira interrogans]UML83055.1 hypothetical protein FH587_04230 [Leptospira interrogans]
MIILITDPKFGPVFGLDFILQYFSIRVAQRYIQAYQNKDQIADIDLIKAAYKKILSENPVEEQNNPED